MSINFQHISIRALSGRETDWYMQRQTFRHMSLHRTNTFAYGSVRYGPSTARHGTPRDNTQTGQVCLQTGCLLPAGWWLVACGWWATWLLADSDGGGAIRRNESTNQHTQQIRQQDADAFTLTAAHCVSFPFPADNVDCSKVCLSISKMVFVKWAHSRAPSSHQPISPSAQHPSIPVPQQPRTNLNSARRLSVSPSVGLLGFWICIAQQQQSLERQKQNSKQSSSDVPSNAHVWP